MKLHICRLSFLLALVALLGPNAGFVPAGGQGKVDEIEKKLQAVRQQVEELHKQEQSLLKQREKLKAEEAEREKMYIRVEIRGVLRKISGRPRYQPSTLGIGGQTVQWNVAINDLVWVAYLGDNKERLTAAEQMNGKTVVITGQMLTVTNRDQFVGTPTTVVVESLRLAEPLK